MVNEVVKVMLYWRRIFFKSFTNFLVKIGLSPMKEH
jgi:hypothetical protein